MLYFELFNYANTPLIQGITQVQKIMNAFTLNIIGSNQMNYDVSLNWYQLTSKYTLNRFPKKSNQ